MQSSVSRTAPAPAPVVEAALPDTQALIAYGSLPHAGEHASSLSEDVPTNANTAEVEVAQKVEVAQDTARSPAEESTASPDVPTKAASAADCCSPEALVAALSLDDPPGPNASAKRLPKIQDAVDPDDSGTMDKEVVARLLEADIINKWRVLSTFGKTSPGTDGVLTEALSDTQALIA